MGSTPTSAAKLCGKCNTIKSYAAFNKKSQNKKHGLQSYCRECSAAESQRIVTEKQDYVRNLLSAGCMDCGLDDWRILEFDHRPGEERIKCVSELVGNSGSMEKLVEEVAKCDIVCPNCHTMRTLERSGSWRLR